jgi:hypothetical protein
MNVLVLEQRAWRGIRLEAKTRVLKEGVTDRDFHLSIGYHVPMNKCFVHVEYCRESKRPGWPRECYGGIDFYAYNKGENVTGVDQCIAWIEREFNVKVEVEGEKIAQPEPSLRNNMVP